MLKRPSEKFALQSPIFNLLLTPLVPGLGLYTLHRRFIQKRSEESFRAQWGQVSEDMRAFGRHKGPKIWLHAVSVGETMAAKPIARALKDEIPNLRIALSSTTDTGHDLALSLVKDRAVDCCFYFPLDLPPIQTRFLNALRPDAICFVETELWPNLLNLARRKGIPTFLVNGRVSDNLLKTAPKLGPLWKWMSGNISKYLMRGESDAERAETLGVDKSRIFVTGDVKLESPSISGSVLRQQWRHRLGLTEEPLIVAGSTHAGEEQMLLEAYKAELVKFPHLKLVIAPRHVERSQEVADLIRAEGFEVTRRSELKPLDNNSIFLLDTIGELSDVYAAGDVAFVGGSLIPRGGHNVLEPVLRGTPVVFGPHMMNFRAAAELVAKNEIGSQIEDFSELAPALSGWLRDNEAANFKAKVSAALQPHQGAAKRLAQQVAAFIQ